MLKLPLRPHLERQFDSLPEKVKFCKRCVMSNQRPRIEFDNEGICQPCRYYETRDIKINWEERKEKFLKMLDNFRSKDGSYDVIVPCSGGKDTSMLAHRLKYEYGMHPLCYTFAPPIYTEIGWKNLRNFIDTGFDNFLFTPGGPLYRSLCKIGLIVLGDHLEIWDRAVLSIPPRLALQNNVKLIMYGENAEVEYGGASHLANKPNMPWENFENIYYSTDLDNLIKIGIEDGYFTEEIQENTFHRSMALSFVFTLLGELYLSATVGPTRQIQGQIPAEVFGTAKAIGIELFSKHIVAFELASGLLLVAAVGVICLAKFSFAPLRRRAR